MELCQEQNQRKAAPPSSCVCVCVHITRLVILKRLAQQSIYTLGYIPSSWVMQRQTASLLLFTGQWVYMMAWKGGGGRERNASGCQDQKKERTFIYISYGEEDDDDFLPFYNLDDMEPIYLFKKSKSIENLFSLLVQQRSAANGPSPKVDLATSTSL